MKKFVAVLTLLLGMSLFQRAGAQGISIGYVDFSEIYNQFTNLPAAQNQLQELTNSLQQSLNLHISYFMLTTQEREELKQLLAKSSLTDADKKRIDELEQLAVSREKELQQLENTANPTEQQKKRLEELQNLRQTASRDIDAIRQEYDNRAKQKQNELLQEMEKNIRAKLQKLGINPKEGEELDPYIFQALQKVIGDVAKANNISIVLDKRAVLFGGVDLTQKVIQALNK